MPIESLPLGGHDWLPTVTMTKLQCQRCLVKVTKQQLVEGDVPIRCKPRKGGGKRG